MDFSLTPFEAVADRVYVAVAEPATVNVGLVVGTTGALLVDTGSSPAQGRAIRAAAASVLGEAPLTDVVVTHAHFDHCYGLSAFAGSRTWGHRNLPEAREHERLAEELAELGLTRGDLALPARTFSLAATIDLGDCHAELVHFGPGHTTADVAVHVPARGVVFAGDLLESAPFAWAGPDSSLADWPRTLDGTLGTLRRDTVVVPGHGPAMDRAAAFIQRAELAWLEATLVALWDAGTAVEHVWDSTSDWPLPRAQAEEIAAVRFAQYERAGRPRRRPLPLLRPTHS